MAFASLHAGASTDLPLSRPAALSAMLVGLLVLAVVAHDAYRVYLERIAPRVETDHE